MYVELNLIYPHRLITFILKHFFLFSDLFSFGIMLRFVVVVGSELFWSIHKETNNLHFVKFWFLIV